MVGVRVNPHGNEESPSIAFIGGFPSAEEGKRNQAFAGNAGKLLRQLITILELDPEDIYYTHAVKFRLPRGKKPTARVIHENSGELWDELLRVDPRIIVPMGNEALTAIIGGGRGITRRRGVFQEQNGFAVVPTLEPSKMSPEAFPDLVHDLAYVKSILEGQPAVIVPPYEKYVLVNTQEEFDSFVEQMRSVEAVAIDIETNGLDFLGGEILSASFSWEREQAQIVDWYGLVRDSKANQKAMTEILARCKCYFHNAQFDTLWLRARGYEVNLAGDTMLLHYLLDERQGTHGLKRLSIDMYRSPEYDDELKAMLRAKHRGESIASVSTTEDDRKAPLVITVEDWSDESIREKVMIYNGTDTDYTWRLVEDLSAEVEDEGMMHIHDDILIPAVDYFTELELVGMLVDTEYHDKMGAEWQAEIDELETKLRSYSGAEDLNFRSPKQVSEFIYDTLGLRTMPAGPDGKVSVKTVKAEIEKYPDPEAQDFWRKAPSPSYTDLSPRSTNAFMLYWLAQQHEWPRMLIRHRDLSKMLGTYYEGYRDIMGENMRVRPRYRIHGTRTGRLSSTDPNIHGMPRRDAIRDFFIADPGYTILGADYSQAEIRMMGHFAGDENLKKVMDETDIHRSISLQIFRLTEEELSALPSEEISFKRRAAKTIAFGLIYGRGAGSIAPQLDISKEEAEGYIDSFFEMMPDVHRYIQREQQRVLREQEVRSLYGRKRRFPYIADHAHSADVKRQAVNMPIQSSVSDMTLMAMLRIVERLRSEGISVLPWPHVHDGFYLQIEDSGVDRAIEVTKEVMHTVPFETDVHFAMEIEIGKRWGELEPVYNG